MSKKRSGLGRGLNALIPATDTGEKEEGVSLKERIHDIEIGLIKTNPNQPRKHFDKDKIEELAKSVKRHGIIQPVIVSQEEKGYRIIAGERRYRAAREANLKSVPCIIREAKPAERMELALIENLQREDLNPIEEAMAFRLLMDEHGLTQEKVSDVAGKSRPYVANLIRLLGLEDEIKGLIAEGKITGGHGRTLLGLPSGEKRKMLLERIVEKGLSVREAERQVKLILSEKQEKNYKKPIEIDPEVLIMEETLRERFATKVNIKNGRKNEGKIEISYHGLDEFERIMNLLRK
ncbi:MAG: ParB/RepB/Spo0J family partition protein [Peptostreptococcaceae bacterium]|nr:ParB/RepB/Spo0J family partition protein [Peptostreptococcaceae bacterium]